MPDHLANHVLPPDRSKHPAVNTLRVIANDIYLAVRADVLDALDQ